MKAVESAPRERGDPPPEKTVGGSSCDADGFRLNQRSASFETTATRPPQDKEFFLMSARYLLLRSARSARLEARTIPMQLYPAGRRKGRTFDGLPPPRPPK